MPVTLSARTTRDDHKELLSFFGKPELEDVDFSIRDQGFPVALIQQLHGLEEFPPQPSLNIAHIPAIEYDAAVHVLAQTTALSGSQ